MLKWPKMLRKMNEPDWKQRQIHWKIKMVKKMGNQLKMYKGIALNGVIKCIKGKISLKIQAISRWMCGKLW